MESVHKRGLFFPILQSYLFEYDKMHINELERDFLVNKELEGELKLIPLDEYEENSDYFK